MKALAEADDFGAIDADNDDLLLESFEDHPAFTSLLKLDHFLVVGRKGAGKTAIFKKLITQHGAEFFSFGHTFSDYPWHHHALQARLGIPDFDKYTHSWKYLILITLSKILLNQDQSVPFDDASLEASSKLERFVIDSYGSRDPDVTQVFAPTKRLKLKPHFEIDFGLLSAGVSPEAVPMQELPSIVSEVNRNLTEWLVACLNPDHEYFVAFDQLDLGFSPEDDDYRDRLIGLLLAARDLNQAARDARRSALVAVFLRDDIYDQLHFEDKNKLTENSLSMIEWDTDESSPMLMSLMEKRFTAVLASEAGERVAWADVFDEEQEMPGHQTKYQHVLDRTYLRPRDMIKFTNAILERYKWRLSQHAEKEGQRFENADLHEARVEYSDYLRAELDDEVHKHLPEYDRWLDLFTAIGGWQFDKETFAATAMDWSLAQAPQEAVETLEQLFSFSIVGFYRPGGRGYGGSEYVFRYREPKARFDPTASLFRVHPGLIEVLGLKRTTARRSESRPEASDTLPLE